MSASAFTIVLPPGYQYVGAAVTSTFWLLVWQVMKVSKARKASGITYPQVYAEKAEAAASHAAQVFNCTQRANQNTLEYLNMVIGSTLLLGLKHPIIAASLCASWTLARVVYTIGYSSGNPKNRKGGPHMFINLLLLLGGTYVVGEYVFQSL